MLEKETAERFLGKVSDMLQLEHRIYYGKINIRGRNLSISFLFFLIYGVVSFRSKQTSQRNRNRRGLINKLNSVQYTTINKRLQHNTTRDCLISKEKERVLPGIGKTLSFLVSWSKYA